MKFSREFFFKVLGILLCILVILPTLIKRTDRADLRLIVNAAERLSSGKAVYDLRDLDEHTKPPLCTFLFLPLQPIPFFWLGRIWDVINVSLFVFLAIYFAQHFNAGSRENSVPLGLLGILFTLSSWNAEIRLGQFNVIGMGLFVFAASAFPVVIRSFALVFAILLKPTNIIFLPWIVRFGKRPVVLGALSVAWVIILSTLYVVDFGFSALIQDHQSWLAFLQPSSQKHIMRLDNLGIPSAVAIFSGKSYQNLFLGLGLLFTALLSWKWPRHSWQVFALASVMVVVFSPMAWPQNYSLLLPLAIWIWRERMDGKKVGIPLLIFYVTQQLYNPSTWDFWGPLGRVKLPLIGALLVVLTFLLSLYRQRNLLFKQKRSAN